MAIHKFGRIYGAKCRGGEELEAVEQDAKRQTAAPTLVAVARIASGKHEFTKCNTCNCRDPKWSETMYSKYFEAKLNCNSRCHETCNCANK